MTKIQKLTLGMLFTFLSINILGCSDGKTTINSPPTILISPAVDFDFGTVTQGNITSPLGITITNIGGERLDIDSITLSDTLNFKLNPNSGTKPCINLSTALPAGESCTIEITFTPNTFPSNPSTVFAINSNDLTTPSKTINLAGTSELVSDTLTVTINQVEVDAASCSNVVAYVSVTDQSNFPVEGLSATDFTITEGLSAPISPISADTVEIVTKPISIAIVMDNSSSMSVTDIDEMNQAAIDVVAQLDSADEAEIIKFNQAVSVVQEFTANKDLLTTAINSPFVDNGTALYEALQQAILDTDIQSTERKAIIVITDGADNIAPPTATLTDVTDAAKAKGIPIFVIALGNFNQGIIDNVLKPIATETSGEFYEADVAQNFSTIIEQQLTEVLFTDQYILTYASGSTGSGIKDVDLTIDVSTSGGFPSGAGNKLVDSCP